MLVNNSEKRKEHNKLVLLAKAKINSVEILISKALIDSYINQNKSVLVNNVLRKYDDMKEAIDLFIKHGYIYIY